jgi:hypothetical protein
MQTEDSHSWSPLLPAMFVQEGNLLDVRQENYFNKELYAILGVGLCQDER